VAPAIAELAGGAERLAERARDFVAEGKPLEALHLLDIALAADPGSAAGREAKREALKLLDKQTGGANLWERMSIAAELRALEG
jgi:alkyl sulfatase BDS1-like metallo-beta-lactamase superfamily hydrolase